MIRLGILRPAADLMAKAAQDAMAAYREGRIEDEPQITERFLAAAETRFNDNFSVQDGRSLAWRAKTLRPGSGSAAQEKRHGADLLGVFTANLEDYKVSKGFLAQAKKAEPRVPFSNKEWNRLQSQCERMLKRTPDAFVITYSITCGIRFFSALGVLSYKGRDIYQLYGMSPRKFFERHFQSFIGDRRLDAPRIEVLDKLLAPSGETQPAGVH